MVIIVSNDSTGRSTTVKGSLIRKGVMTCRLQIQKNKAFAKYSQGDRTALPQLFLPSEKRTLLSC